MPISCVQNSIMKVAKGTFVLTLRGYIPIEEVLPSDYVWTEFGWVMVLENKFYGEEIGYEVFSSNNFQIIVGRGQFFVTGDTVYGNKIVTVVEELQEKDKIGVIQPQKFFESMEKKFKNEYFDKKGKWWETGKIHQFLAYCFGFVLGLLNFSRELLVVTNNSIVVLFPSNRKKYLSVFLSFMKKYFFYESFLYDEVFPENEKYGRLILYFQPCDEKNPEELEKNAEKRLFLMLLKLNFPKIDGSSLDFIMHQDASCREAFLVAFSDARHLFSINGQVGYTLFFSDSFSFLEKMRHLLFSVGIETKNIKSLLYRFLDVEKTDILYKVFIINFKDDESLDNYGKIYYRTFRRPRYLLGYKYKNIKLKVREKRTMYIIQDKGELVPSNTRLYLKRVVSGSLPQNPVYPSTVISVRNTGERYEFYGLVLETVHFCLCNGYYLHTTLFV